MIELKMDAETMLKYLDEAIEYWRDKRDDSEEYEFAHCYIDAFQSVRVSLFGELLEPRGRLQ